MESVQYVGMDVDKEKIAIAVLRGREAQAETERVIRNEGGTIRRFFESLKSAGDLVSCYEAGCMGFSLHRQLTEMGVPCVVAAPSQIPHRPGDRVKTDRRDALMLARALRNGDISAVHVPSREDEAVRDYLRMLEDMKGDLRKAKQRVLSFLLRRRIRYEKGKTWTQQHRVWLQSLQLEDPLEQLTLTEYRCQVDELEEKVRRIKAGVEEIACQKSYAGGAAKLKAFKGVDTLIALSLLCEIGDFRRFAGADQFMAFLGLVPSERSSGSKRRLGGITKAGNSHLRKLLVEAAWAYRSYHPHSVRLMRRREGLAPSLVGYANRAGRRLNKKFLRLIFRGKASQTAITAVARELSGFLWGAMVDQVA
jgi:transposase